MKFSDLTLEELITDGEATPEQIYRAGYLKGLRDARNEIASYYERLRERLKNKDSDADTDDIRGVFTCQDKLEALIFKAEMQGARAESEGGKEQG